MSKQWVLLAAFCMFFLVAGVASAQQLDVAFGFGTVGGNPASDATATAITNGTSTAQSISGGGYPAFSGDFLFFKKYIGVGAGVAWRSHQNVNIFNQPYRPILYNFDGVWGPPVGKRAQVELMGGVGVESLRFYTPFFTCTGSIFPTCKNYSSSNHFLGHFGAGLRMYVTRNIFIRPEAQVYLVRNNIEFSGSRVTRVAVSIGYSLKNQF